MSEWNYAKWAENLGQENLKHRLATGDILLSQANTLLSILLVGIGGGMTYAMKSASSSSYAELGAAASTAWMAAVAAVLVFKCIATRETEVIGSSPLNVYKPSENLTETQIREFNMELIQDRIRYTRGRNASVAYWLDRCRYATVFTPFVYAFSALAASG